MEGFIKVNYIKACLHANGNNQIKIKKLIMQKTQLYNFRRMESSSNVIVTKVLFVRTDVSELFSKV